MNQKKQPNQVLGYVASGIGVIILSLLAWSKLGRMNGAEIAVAVGVTVLVIGGVFVWAKSRDRDATKGQSTVGTELEGWTLHQAWAASTLGAALTAHGTPEPGMSAAGGTRLTLAWSASGVSLWRSGRQPHQVVTLGWAEVAAVGEGMGEAASSPRPAIVIQTATGVELTVVPTAKPGGGLLPASRATVQQLVADLRAARDGVVPQGVAGDTGVGEE